MNNAIAPLPVFQADWVTDGTNTNRTTINAFPAFPADCVTGTPNVVVIESNEDSRYLWQVLLETKGFTVKTVDGIEALLLREATQLVPDLIILNIIFPDERSLQLLQQIYADPLFCDVPIILTLSYNFPAFQLQALNAGAKAILVKPIEFDTLDRLLKHCLC